MELGWERGGCHLDGLLPWVNECHANGGQTGDIRRQHRVWSTLLSPPHSLRPSSCSLVHDQCSPRLPWLEPPTKEVSTRAIKNTDIANTHPNWRRPASFPGAIVVHPLGALRFLLYTLVEQRQVPHTGLRVPCRGWGSPLRSRRLRGGVGGERD